MTAQEPITIARDVLFSNSLFVSDHLHGTEICDCWLAIDGAILPGVRIGRPRVIGAIGVVTHGIPGHSIAAGVRAPC